MARVGKTADSIFKKRSDDPKPKVVEEVAPVETNEALEERRGRGRPQRHDEPWTKATVVLFDRQIAELDKLSAEIRLATGAAVKRSEIIRALVQAMIEAGEIPLDQVESEKDLKEMFLRWFSQDT